MSEPTPISEILAWEERRINSNERLAPPAQGMEWEEVLAKLAAMPPETAEESAVRLQTEAQHARRDRLAAFKRICPPEFSQRLDRGRLPNPAAFDAVAQWQGRFRGILASGKTGCGKTRAAWSALGRLQVEEGRTFAWFPVKRLITEYNRYEGKDLADEFWRYYRNFNALFVDDLDKFNSQFESESSAIFQFYDWAYRENKAVITTTNKPRKWWEKLMGEAFTRRLFDEIHTHIDFDAPNAQYQRTRYA